MDPNRKGYRLGRAVFVGGLAVLCLAAFLPHFDSDKVVAPCWLLFWIFGGDLGWAERVLMVAAWPPFLLLLTAAGLVFLVALAEVFPGSRWWRLAPRICGAIAVAAMFAPAWLTAMPDLPWSDRYAGEWLLPRHIWRSAMWACLPIGLAGAAAVVLVRRSRAVPLAYALGGLACLLSLLSDFVFICDLTVEPGFWGSVLGCMLVIAGAILWLTSSDPVSA